MKNKTSARRLQRQQKFLAQRSLGRNDAWFDIWSLVHLVTGVIFGWIMAPFVALAIMIVWEPIEILGLSPLLARSHIHFGYETFRNSLSDIVVDVAGVALGYYLLLNLAVPPFHLF
ncbi:MAG TPA: hypothetical protein VHB51_00145 [Candidatus Saccharimonadales bacterium]|nr:hypothetical protein [Candidatus Saccharimonadales bacterium]